MNPRIINYTPISVGPDVILCDFFDDIDFFA